jgi:hypothetical protein
MRANSIVALAGLASAVAAGAEPVRLQPSSPWVVDYAENSCRLIRSFGNGKSAVKLIFESAAPYEMDLLVAGKPLETSQEEVPAKFLPLGEKAFKGRAAQAVTNEPAILWPNVPMLPHDLSEKVKQEAEQQNKNRAVRPPLLNLAEQAARKEQRHQYAAAATEVAIYTRRDRPVILETGSLGAPIVAFDQCSRNSLKDWGVNPDVDDKIVRRVWAPNPYKWFSSDDYPKDMLRMSEQSEVRVRLLVDASGKVTKCTSLTHFDRPEFNKVVCDKFMARAVFEPAELSDGTKVPSYYINRVVFRLEHY